MRLRTRVAIAAASGVAGALAFPTPGLWPLSFVVWAPVIVALEGARARAGALIGFVAGVAFFAVSLRWLTALTPVGWAVLSVLLAGYLALAGAVAAVLLERADPGSRAAVPAAWIAIEWMRGWLFSGFGWGALGYALAPSPRFIQLAALGGVPLVSFGIMGCNCALAIAWLALRRDGWRATRVPLAIAAAAPIFMAAHGSWALATADDASASGELRVAVIQAAMSPHDKWGDDGIYTSGQRYVGLSDTASQQHPQLIVWPETAIPAPLDGGRRMAVKSRGLRRRVQDVWRAPLLFGIPEPASDVQGAYYNSAELYATDGEPRAPYRKRRLVPFGEYRPALFSFLPRVIEGPRFVHGTGGPPFDIDGVTVGVLICFEDVFPTEAIARAQRADLLAVITNDAWFGTSGIAQHFDIAVLRAVENRRSVARAANTGISGLIDPYGRVQARAPGGQSYAIGEVPLMHGVVTPFSRAPDLVPMIGLASMLLALGFAIARRRSLRQVVDRDG